MGIPWKWKWESMCIGMGIPFPCTSLLQIPECTWYVPVRPGYKAGIQIPVEFRQFYHSKRSDMRNFSTKTAAILQQYTLVKDGQIITDYRQKTHHKNCRSPKVDLRVAAVKSTESTWPLQVKSSHFSSKSPPKFSTQVAAEF